MLWKRALHVQLKKKNYIKWNKIGDSANKCRSSNRSHGQGKLTQRLLQKKQFTLAGPKQEKALSRSQYINFMNVKGCVDVVEFSTVDDSFDKGDWLASIDVSYNLPINLTTSDSRDPTITTIHNIQQGQRSQAYTKVHIVPEDTNNGRIGPNMEVRFQIDIDAGAKIVPLSVFRRLCPVMFDSTRKAFEKSLSLIGPSLQHIEVQPSSSLG